MLKFRKSSLIGAAVFSAACLFAGMCDASIVRYYDRGARVGGMPTLIMLPASETQANAMYQMQRAHSWGNYRRSRGAVGYSVASGAYGGAVVVADTPRQANLRMNMARAHAFGHGYFNR